MGPPLGQLGPLETDLVGTEGEVGHVQGCKPPLGILEHTQGFVRSVGKRQLGWEQHVLEEC